MNNIDYRFDVLVRVRLFFRQPLTSQRFDYDTAGFEFLLNFLCRYTLLGSRSAQDPAGPMASRSESFPHCSVLPQQKVRRGAHASRDEDRLVRKGASRALAVDHHTSRLTINGVRLPLRNIVSHVVN